MVILARFISVKLSFGKNANIGIFSIMLIILKCSFSVSDTVTTSLFAYKS